MLGLLNEFSRGLAQHMQGTPGANGLLQMIKPRQLRFRKAIRATAPDFKPFERCEYTREGPAPIPEFLKGEEDEATLSVVEGKAMYLDDVWSYAQK